VARGLTPELRIAVLAKCGTIENAIGEARWESPELQSLWEQGERGDWPDRDEFWEVFWGKALPVLGISTAAVPAAGYELVNGPLGDGLEPDPYSEPEPLDAAVFDDVTGRLSGGEELRSISRETGLSMRQVTKIRDYKLHPNRLGPTGSDGYGLYRQPSRPGTISLRKLRPVRA
jgi:hypothetical protein